MEASPASGQVAASLEQARQHYQAGRWQKAEELCQRILQTNPTEADALHLLGLIAGQSGRYQPAADYLRATVRLQPDLAAAHNDLGNALVLLGKLPEAIDSFREAVRSRPDFALAHSNLGNALQEMGHREEALANLREAVRLRPDFTEARFNLGVALQAQGHLPEAVESYQQVLRLKPDHVDAFCNLGMVLWKQGKFNEAFAQYQHALRLHPDHAVACNNQGAALQELGRLGEAEASLRQALLTKPDHADALCNLGIVLWKQGNMDESVAQYQKALRLQPDHAEALVNLGNVYKDQARLDLALEAYRAALHIKPDAAEIHSNLLLALNYHPGYDAPAIAEECARWNRTHAEPLRKLIQPHGNRPDPERRLRIGYVSPDFREHVDSFFTIPLLSNHDHEKYQIFCYANVPRPDAMTERLKGYADFWRSTVGLSDQQIADLVRGDQIDILVDLELHAAKNRLLMFARKPAPVQVAWLGYPGTTGLSTMDCRLTDPYLDPPGLFDAFYSEESIRLPDTFWCYNPLSDEPAVNALSARQTGIVTFGCLNNFCKVNDGCLSLWARVLRKVPQSRLLLRAPRGQARENVIASLRKEGIAEGRIELVESVPRQKYLQTYHRIDLGLDPVPCSGHTTSLDAFWMGVPTVTLLGKTAMGRAGFSQLCNLGLAELAAQTPEQYVELATSLANDLPRLEELRRTLRDRMRRSPLMDGTRFTRHVEQAYRQMWHRWCTQQDPLAATRTDGSPQPEGSKPDAKSYFQRGITLAQNRKYEDAAASFQEGLRLQPDSAGAHNDLGMILILQGKLSEAVESFRQAVRFQPDFAFAYSNLGNALRELGNLDEALANLQKAVLVRPDFVEAHLNLGIALEAQGKLDEATASYRQALHHRPNYADGHFNLGNALSKQGKPDEAVAHLQEALRCKSGYAEAHHSLANALKTLGRSDQAIIHYQHAIRLKPDADIHIVLGNAFQEQGDLPQALAHYRQAALLQPDNFVAHSNMGNALREMGQLEEAEASLRQALAIKPDFVPAFFNLGIVLPKLGRVDEAVAALRAALRFKPDAADIHSCLLVTLNYHPDYDARAIGKECARWNQQHALPLRKLVRPHANRPDPERRLRIGYVSPHFSDHVDSFFTIPLLSNHNHEHYEIFCYANVTHPDAMTKRLKGYADLWRSTVGLSDQQIADLVRSDQIDVLVDLELHVANNRLLMFARKPAPVQVAWLGYPGTTGLSTMDYRLTDPYLDPPGLFDAFYSEESIRLPDTFWCYDPWKEEPLVNALPALETGTVTFGCLNNFCKINEGCLALWSAVLRKVPRSRFLLRAPRGQTRDHLLAGLRQEGMTESRLEFIDHVTRPEYLKLYHRIDLGLDPVPCSGHTTSLDAFWMGVPTVTLLGKTAMGRAGFSQLCNLGLSELAAQTPEQYVELAASWASDLEQLQKLRGSLRERMKQSPLMDGERFARGVEQAYRHMWRRWCDRRDPAPSKESGLHS
jgi:predicted O-linked N-acetylglucosamine transferase (SPINDLY family)